MIRSYLERLYPILAKPADGFLALENCFWSLFSENKIPKEMVIDEDDLISVIKDASDAVHFLRIEFGADPPYLFNCDGLQVLDSFLYLGEGINFVIDKLDFIVNRYFEASKGRQEQLVFEIETVKDIKRWFERIQRAWLVLRKRDKIRELLNNKLKNHLRTDVIDFIERLEEGTKGGILGYFFVDKKTLLSLEIYRRQIFCKDEESILNCWEGGAILFLSDISEDGLKELVALLKGSPSVRRAVGEKYDRYLDELKYSRIDTTYFPFLFTPSGQDIVFRKMPPVSGGRL